MPPLPTCPSCSNPVTGTARSCPKCGFDLEKSVHHRKTTVMEIPPPPAIAPVTSSPSGVALGRIDLKKAPQPTAVDEGPALELPPEELTDPAAPGYPTPSMRLGVPSGMSLTLPGEPTNSPAVEPPSAAGAPLELPHDGGPGLELPHDERDEPRPLPSAPRAPLPTAPRPVITREQPATPLPGWLTDLLPDRARAGVLLGVPLAVLLAVDATTAGRWGAATPTLWAAALSALGASVALWLRQRVALVGVLVATALNAVASQGSVLELGAAIGWGVACLLLALAPATQRVMLAFGAACLLALSPALLDGVLPQSLLASAPPGPAQRLPLVDQHTGLQLDAPLNEALSTRAAGDDSVELVAPVAGVEVLLVRLPPRLDPQLEAAAEALRAAGLERVALEPTTAAPGAFDTATDGAFNARRARAALRGVVRIGVLADEVLLVAAWTRASRYTRHEATLTRLTTGAVFRPPARPKLEATVRGTLQRSLLSGPDVDGVRLSWGTKVLALLPHHLSTGTVETAQGPIPLELSSAAREAGVAVVPLGGGQTAAPRRFAGAPRLSRFVRLASGFAGGWVTDEPGAPVRQVSLPDARTGPAFDLEGNVVGFVVKGPEQAQLVTLDALEPVLRRVAGEPFTPAEATTKTPPPLFVPVAPDDEQPPELPPGLERSIVQARSSAGVTAAVVARASDLAWMLIADAVIAPAGTTTVQLQLKDGDSRAAEVVRSTGRLVVLKALREDGDGLKPAEFVDGAPSAAAGRVAWGYRRDAATQALSLKAQRGELSSDGFDGVPGPELSTGPVITPEGRVAALRLGPQAVAAAPEVEALTSTGIRDVVWRVLAEPTGVCQLAASVELEDPTEDATLVRVRIDPVTGDAPPSRLTSASFTDTKPSHGAAELLFRFPCFTTPRWLQFDVQSGGRSQATTPQRLPPPNQLPGVVRGRTGASSAGLKPALALSASLWELPSPVTMQHACRAKPTLCERACAVDEIDACTLDGRHALATGEIGRAIGRLDPRCAAGDVEACVLLQWALAEKKSARVPAAKPVEVLQPWCDAGVGRACAALATAQWKSTLAEFKAKCTSATTCAALGHHLLLGPRLDTDVTAALGHLRRACGSRELEACAESALLARQLAQEDPVAVTARAELACAGGRLEACVLAAENAAKGYTVPRSLAAADKALADFCEKGSAEACLMSRR